MYLISVSQMFSPLTLNEVIHLNRYLRWYIVYIFQNSTSIVYCCGVAEWVIAFALHAEGWVNLRRNKPKS